MDKDILRRAEAAEYKLKQIKACCNAYPLSVSPEEIRKAHEDSEVKDD